MKTKSFILKPTSVFATLNSIVFFVISIILVAIPYYFSLPYVFIFISVIPFFLGVYKFIYWKLVRYEVNVNQLKYTRGVFNLQEDYLELYRVKDFVKSQPLHLRIFNIMNFTINTSDVSHPTLIMKGIPVSNIADVLRELVEKSRITNRVFEVD